MSKIRDFVAAPVASLARSLGKSTVRRKCKQRAALTNATLPMAEALEQRSLLTIVFPLLQYGNETPVKENSVGLQNPTINIIFAGDWSGYAADKATLLSRIESLITGPYLSGLAQYGATGTATVGAIWNDPNTTPGAILPSNPTPSVSGIQPFVQNSITTYGTDPGNHLIQNAPMYLVILDPTTSMGDNGGFNVPGTYTSPTTQQAEPINMEFVGTGTLPSGALDIDHTTATCGHELAERIVNNEYQFYLPPAYNNAQGQPKLVQVSDGEEENNYYYRVDGVWLQAYYSALNNAAIVPDIAYSLPQETFTMNPLPWVSDGRGGLTSTGKYNLVVSGDELSNHNDFIDIGEDAAGGVSVTLNTETVSFESGEINTLAVNSGAGQDSIFIDALVTPTTVICASPANGPDDNVLIGNGSTAELNSPLTLINLTGYDVIDVSDSTDAAAKNVQVLNSTIPGMGTVVGIAPINIQYTYSETRSLYVDTGEGGNNVVTVDQTEVPTFITGHGVASSTTDTFDIGGGGHTLQGIQSQVTLADSGQYIAQVDDSSDSAARSFALGRAPTPGYGALIAGSGDNVVEYSYLHANLAVDLDSKENTATVLATGGESTTFSGGALGHFQMSAGATATLQQPTVDGGAGGGIVNSGNLTVLNCPVQGNSTSGNGGGIVNMLGATLLVSYSEFYENTAGGAGGGIYNLGAATLVNDTFFANSAYDGGGLYDNAGSSKIIDCTFSHNRAAQNGGAIEIGAGGFPILTNCLFQNNTALNGGAIDVNDATFYALNCAFLGNSAGTTDGAGGAVQTYNSTGDFVNCTFLYNQALVGGAVVVENGSPSFYNCILWDDSATNYSEIYTIGRESVLVETSDVDQSSFTVNNNNNVNNIDAAPVFVGSTAQLATGSPAATLTGGTISTVNYAETNYFPGLTTDLTGNPRIVSNTVGMGAYEYQGPITLVYAPGPSPTVVSGTPTSITVDVQQGGQNSSIENGDTILLDVNGIQVGSATVNGYQAVFPSVTINTQAGITAGANTLVASDAINPSDGTISQGFILSAGSNIALSFSGLPTGVTVNQTFGEFGVEVTEGGQPDTGDTSLINLYIDGTGSPVASGYVGNGVNGYALFNGDVSFPSTGSHFLQARDTTDGITINSGTIQVNSQASNPMLTFGTLPSTPMAGSAFNPELQVNEIGSNGQTVTSDNNSTVYLAISINGVYQSTLQTKVVSGIAYFPYTPPAGGSYSFTATDTDYLQAQTGFTVGGTGPLKLKFIQQPQSSVVAGGAVAGTSSQVIVDVLNSLNQPVTDDMVTLSVIFNGFLAGQYSVAAVNGVATFGTSYLDSVYFGFNTNFPSYSIGSIANPHFLIASDTTPGDTGATTATSSAFNITPGPVYGLAVSSATTGAGSTFDLNAYAEDFYGDDATGAPADSITLSLVNAPAGVALEGNPTATIQNGVATFPGLSLNTDVAGVYAVTATDTNEPSLQINGGSITLTAGAFSKLGFLIQPSPVSTQSPIEPSFTVAAEDQFGNVVTSVNPIEITVSIASGTAGATLSGMVTQSTVNGVATFGGISLNATGMYYLNAVDTRGDLITSTSFAVSAPFPYYVDQNAPSGGHGLSWATAFTSLQSALAVAIPGNTIDVAQGDYTPGADSPITDPTSTFTLLDGVTIQGGFPTGGSNTPYPAAYPTLLDGQGISYHVVTADGTNSSAVLEGFTITGGNASGTGDADSQYGGGLIADGGAPTIINCIFTANTAVYGGAMYIANQLSAGAMVTNCIFENNTITTGGGGAIYILDSSPTILNSQFLNNSTTDDGDGGAILNSDSDPTLVNCLLTGNMTNRAAFSYEGAYGGAISDVDSSPTITNCTITGNSAIFGGGVANDGASSPILTNDILWNNNAEYGGNEIYGGNSTVTNSLVGGGYAGTGNINADPLFVDAAGGNYQLQPTSPCINSGNDAAPELAGLVTDLADNNRIVDGVVDMGAYEAQLVSVTWTGLGDGIDWSDPNNWSDNLVPTQNDDVIVPAGFGNVDVDPGSFFVHSLNAATQITIVGGSLTLKGASVISPSLLFQGGGTLDVLNSVLTIDYGANPDPISAIQGDVQSGYNNGTWSGSGIISSTAASDSSNTTGVGYIDNGSQITVAHTWYGDANLDGVINADDLSLILLGQATGKTGWQYGNFNYDNTINADDWIKLMYAVAYSKGQQLTNTDLTSDALIQTTNVSGDSIGRPTANIGLPAFSQLPIGSEADLSDLMDSQQPLL